MPLSLLLRLFWLLRILIADSSVMSQVIGERMKLRAKKIKEVRKRSTIGPIQMIQGKNPRTKSVPKRSIREASGPDQAGANTDYSWYAPQPVVVDTWLCFLGRTAMRPPCPGCVDFPLRLFVLLHEFSVL